MTTTERARTNRRLAELSRGTLTLSDFIVRARDTHIDVADALEGIWCGRSGKVEVDLLGGRHMLVVTWYEGRVEVAYIS
jgi:hypothetical protein